MSREIKFEYIFEMEHTGLRRKEVYTLEQLEDIEMEIILLENDEKIIARRQYTGLKDKGNKHIYFGDIVKFKDGLFKVVFSNGGTGFEQLNNNKIEYNWIVEECKVIGNTHENKDLLNKK